MSCLCGQIDCLPYKDHTLEGRLLTVGTGHRNDDFYQAVLKSKLRSLKAKLSVH
jgi:hypothetical protein